MSGVVVRIAGPNKSIVRHVVPLFARDFARLAPDANGWVGEEANLDVLPHISVPALVRALSSFADHEKSNQEDRNAGTKLIFIDPDL
jgi:hypothetical protein